MYTTNAINKQTKLTVKRITALPGFILYLLLFAVEQL